ncbi:MULTISPECIES: cytochrome bd-I oxidase subunit CydH [Vibrio]|uniref:YnhF family membrane protein n=1 Tax=Vibrio ostreae TaxID=2841925 RepID=A0A975UCJ7_9VIBR|nr:MULTISPECIES: YnhF family membrane protein [Vibrio]QXO18236.1 YnhF family membrane protein [Vibrio ostreae]WGY47441.1 YnhF family membrane protein [Vibrio sp. ABG19]
MERDLKFALCVVVAVFVVLIGFGTIAISN